ncbi:piggyBac transposable element-derived protein 2-like [Centruroides sculpturatus]|uniref:piggyBac transposable element-derived protein 2-like n=1 Tax=Centruroides sculpturatus TaxID=218467 RepID=UPI000C6CA3D9|nr:piggyBac transposable element-derived protein 2-like [Centruroides sculpturatus]
MKTFSQPDENSALLFCTKGNSSASEEILPDTELIDSIVKEENNKDDDELQQILFESDDDEDGSVHNDSDGDLLYEADIESDDEEIDLYSISEELFQNVADTSASTSTLTGSPLLENPFISWSSNVDNSKIFLSSFENNSGPVHNLPPGSPCHSYFKLLFTENMAEDIRINTNKYAEFVAKSTGIIDKLWTPIKSTSEIWAVISIILIMGIVKLPAVHYYWSSHPALGNEMIKKLMPRNRFQRILKYFHLSNREKELPRENPQFNLLQKLEPFMSFLKENYQIYLSPPQNLLISEALFKYKGRSGVVQYKPLNMAKHGLKIWMLCTSNNEYVYNFEVCFGGNDTIPCSGKGQGYDVVMQLTHVLHQPFHHLYFNRVFSSIQLMIDLLAKNIYACGTIFPNRRYLPTTLKALKCNQNEIFVQQCKECPNLLYSTWYDNKPINIVSTNEKMGITYMKKSKGGELNIVPTTCPTVYSNFNKFMGAFNFVDQNRIYNISRKSAKWWFYLFWFLLDTTLQNAYYLYVLTNNPSTKKRMDVRQFRLQVIDGLSRNFSSRKRRGRVSEVIAPITEGNVHLHKKVKIDGRKRTCVQCRRHNRKTISNRCIESSWECTYCNVCLCAKCFEPYHQENM